MGAFKLLLAVILLIKGDEAIERGKETKWIQFQGQQSCRLSSWREQTTIWFWSVDWDGQEMMVLLQSVDGWEERVG